MWKQDAFVWAPGTRLDLDFLAAVLSLSLVCAPGPSVTLSRSLVLIGEGEGTESPSWSHRRESSQDHSGDPGPGRFHTE